MWRDSESEHDFLNFTEVADQIATLATNPGLLPISIGVFGGWGTGKSTVLQLVEAKLPKDGKNVPIVVRFDAWMYQGFDDARAALMEVVSCKLLALAESKHTFIDKAKDFAGRVNYFRGLGLIADFGIGMALGIPPGLLTRAGGALSSILSGAGSADDYGELTKDVSDAKRWLSGLIKPAEKRTPAQEIEAFRREFGELLVGLNTSLVLFIDNLDRCLPDVAIGTLEAIRLFLFMPRTAFVIAADEDMIRHSVAKHFNDPNAAHVRDYLDKVIQVPLRVPQVGTEDLRAYMYSLFVGLVAPDKLAEVQKHLMAALQQGWKGKTFDKIAVAKLAGEPADLLDNLAIADGLAPILAWAPNVQGNPRIVKRLLNAVFLRRMLAAHRGMNVDLATLAKLAVFERCTDGPATLALYRMVMGGDDAEAHLLPAKKGAKALDLPQEWVAHADFIEKWRAMEPAFDDAAKLRPAVFLSRDVMAPARSRSELSEPARMAVESLLKVTSANSPVGEKIVEGLPATDRRTAMSQLIEAMRSADWSGSVPGIHGAVILAKASPDATAELKAFLAGLQTGQMEKGILFLLKQAGLIEGQG
ncbi:MAG: KAP family P-loop NTPase fold protein [Acidobacteriaceae bacterium]